jgi:hypothetical protein
MIVYFRHTAECGGLYYWTGDEDPAVSGQPPELLSTVPPDGCVRVVLLDGDTWHVPQPVKGNGERVSFVFQCEIADDEDDSDDEDDENDSDDENDEDENEDDVALAYTAVAGDSGPSARASELFGMPLWSSVLDECSARVLSGLILQPAPFETPSIGL